MGREKCGEEASGGRIRDRILLLVLSFAPRGFSPRTPIFPSPQKPTLPNSNTTRNVRQEPLGACNTSKSLFIYLFIYLFIHLFILLPSAALPLHPSLQENSATCSSPLSWLLVPLSAFSLD